MKVVSPKLLSLLEEFKTLPKADRQAIERQLTGRDRLRVKQALKPVESTSQVLLEPSNDTSQDSNGVYDHLPNWLAEKIQNIENDEGETHEVFGMTEAVALVLPDCLFAEDKLLEDSPNVIPVQKNKKSFGSILSRMTGDYS